MDCTLTITVPAPRYPSAISPPWNPSRGQFLETLVHELTQHGEVYLDAIPAFRGGADWPVTWQALEHWLFLTGGVPRYCLLLDRMQNGNYQNLVNDFVQSLKEWAIPEEKEGVPASVEKTLKGEPSMDDLRALALLFHLPQPLSGSDTASNANRALTAQLQPKLAPLRAKQPLWWLASMGLG